MSSKTIRSPTFSSWSKAGKRHVEHRRAYAAVHDDILDGRDQIARTPRKSAARFENQPQMGMAYVELLQKGDQRVTVVVDVRHQMAAAHVEPFDPVEVRSEMAFDGLQRQPQVFGTRFAQNVEMKALDPFGKSAVRSQLFGRNAQTRTRHAGVVEIRLDGRILGIDAQSARETVDQRPLSETFILRKGVEGNMAAAAQDLVDVVIRIGGGIGVGRTAEFLQYKPRLGGRTGRRSIGVSRQLGENAPHGAGLQCDDDLGTRFAAHAVDHLQIVIQQRLVKDVTW